MKRCCPSCGSKYFVHYRYGSDNLMECPNPECNRFGRTLTEAGPRPLSIKELEPATIKSRDRS